MLYKLSINEIRCSEKIFHSILHCRMLGKINISIDLPSIRLIPAGLEARDLKEFNTNVLNQSDECKKLFCDELKKTRFTTLDSLLDRNNRRENMKKAVKKNFKRVNKCLKSALEKSRSARQGESSNAGLCIATAAVRAGNVALEVSLRLPSIPRNTRNTSRRLTR